MTQSVQIRLDKTLKTQVEKVLAEIGLDLPTAVRLFFKRVVNSRGIPFPLQSQLTENGFTPEFEEEVLRADKEDETIGPFDTAEEAIAALHKYCEDEDKI